MLARYAARQGVQPSGGSIALSDVSAPWAAGAAEQVCFWGLMEAPGGLFRPNDPLTRGEGAEIVAALLALANSV